MPVNVQLVGLFIFSVVSLLHTIAVYHQADHACAYRNTQAISQIHSCDKHAEAYSEPTRSLCRSSQMGKSTHQQDFLTIFTRDILNGSHVQAMVSNPSL
jgi:hypothetical protein